ncbi:hypothetical protein HDU93_006801 [Gonapodya sp. JEL0774]|nr:hypothetical protein HDU93_006801 [Gonapodya sp. JEL0774]
MLPPLPPFPALNRRITAFECRSRELEVGIWAYIGSDHPLPVKTLRKRFWLTMKRLMFLDCHVPGFERSVRGAHRSEMTKGREDGQMKAKWPPLKQAGYVEKREAEAAFFLHNMIHSAAMCLRQQVLGPLPPSLSGSSLLAFVDSIPAYAADPDFTDKFPSEIADGGFATWHNWTATVGSDGVHTVQENFDELNEDLLQSFFGIAGLEYNFLVINTLHVPTSGLYLFTQPSGPRSFYVDGAAHSHDPFMGGNASFPVPLSAGRRTFAFMGRGFGKEGGFQVPGLVRTLDERGPGFHLVDDDVVVPDLVKGDTVLACSENTPQLTVRISLPDRPALITHINLPCTTHPEAFRFTFPDHRSDNSIHYAAVRPPTSPESCASQGCPVLLSLHGAGVDSASWAWTSSYRSQPRAWVVLPTGRRKYGFDWEGVGYGNAWAAVEALKTLVDGGWGVPEVLKGKVGVDTKRLVYAGHSMGGHGSLLLLTHHPDLALGALPASGWLRHADYLPDFLVSDWAAQGKGWWERAVAQQALEEWEAQGGVGNAVGIPVVGHWFGGVVDDDELQKHFDQWLGIMDSVARSSVTGPLLQDGPHEPSPPPPEPADRLSLPRLPPQFSFSTANPATSGSRGGVRILQLQITGRRASFSVSVTAPSAPWHITTHNVRRIAVRGLESDGDSDSTHVPLHGIVLDGRTFPYALGKEFVYMPILGWLPSPLASWRRVERSPMSYGPARRVWMSGVVIAHSVGFREEALRLAQEVYWRGRGSVDIEEVEESAAGVSSLVTALKAQEGAPLKETDLRELDADPIMPLPARQPNFVIIATPGSNLLVALGDILPHHGPPIAFHAHPTNPSFTLGPRVFAHQFHAIVYIAPLSREDPRRLALIVAGNSANAVRKAVGMIPVYSGSRVGDYVVLGESTGDDGYGGVEGAGWWGWDWGFGEFDKLENLFIGL